MFEIADAGEGTHSIAAQLNAAGVDTWGAGAWKAKYWHRSYVHKLLSNPAAIGVFVPHRVTKVGGKQQRTALEPIANRFPAAVSRELFEAVNNKLSTTAPRGRNASAVVRNIFAGVMRCEFCDGTVTMANKGEHVYLVCSVARAKAGLHRNWSVPYAEAVTAFKHGLPGMLRDAPRGNDGAALQARIDQLAVEIDAGEDAINELLELSISERSAAARAKLRQYEAELETLRAEHRRATERREASASTNVSVRLATITRTLEQENASSAEINKVLRSGFARMTMKLAAGSLETIWHHNEAVQVTRFITSRAERQDIEVEEER